MRNFDWQQYIANYPELNHFTESMAIKHFKRYGQFQQKTDQKDLTLCKITVITPCSRPENLLKIKESLNFEHIVEWIIVYDNIICTTQFENEKISEYCHKSEGKYGFPQRNYGLSVIKNEKSYIHFLDDDNIVHPDLYNLSLLPNKIYTFDQENKDGSLRLTGNHIRVRKIDTAMFLVWFPMVKGIQFITDKYDSDGYYITTCYSNNKGSLIYVPKILCWYNKI